MFGPWAWNWPGVASEDPIGKCQPLGPEMFKIVSRTTFRLQIPGTVAATGNCDLGAHRARTFALDG